MIKFPIEIRNSDIVAAETIEEKVNTQVMLLLTTLRGELAWNTRLGLPFYLFNTRTNIQRDLALVEISLRSEMPTVNFKVTGSLNDDGLAYMEIEWDYNGAEDLLEFEFRID